MSFNRLNYDPCTYMHNLRQSVGAADYQLATPVPHCQPCFSTDPALRMGTGGVSTCVDKPLVDVDSELIGITRQATNCPTQKYIPTGDFCSLRDLKDCRSQMPAEDTRISNPPCTLRGTGWNRWEWLCQNPQDKVLVPFDTNVNTNIVLKDNHRPCIPEPIDQTLVLPPACTSDAVVSYSMNDCGKVNNNVPSVHWQSCSAIRNY
jgi:hypothetical protein